ncbi:MAG: GAF domain-containing protein, partial [Ignavibacteriales bacterium]|nr:GAF domain-containing protein [Ignavibacteriales bacterium]
MTLPFSNLDRKQKLFLAITFSVFLFVYKLIFPTLTSFSSSIINDIIIIISIYLWYIFVIDLKETTLVSPLPLILNTGIVITIIFFILSVSTSIFEKFSSFETESDFFLIIIAILLTYVFTAFFIYVFTSLRILFFLKQKKDYSKLFNITLLFLALSFLSETIYWWFNELSYINAAFSVVTILLLIINSTRVAWIAFLNKKQKIYLLIVSAILTIICGMIGGMLSGIFEQENVISQLIANFSPGLMQFFDLIRIYAGIYFGIIFFTALFHLPTADAFDRRSNELSSLMDLTKLLNQVFDFNELGDTITSMTARVCNSDYAWLVTKKNEKIIISSVFNVGYVETEIITKSLIEENISLFDEVIIIDYERIKNKLEVNSSFNNFSYIAIAPLKVHNDITGYLFAARKNKYSFDEEDKKAIRSFANYASIALENAQLIEQSIEKERLEKELEVAREIQQRLLPAETPRCENVEISSLF